MPSPLDIIEKQAMHLPEDQKVTLAHRMLMSAEPVPDPQVDAMWEAEIIRRIGLLDKDQTTRYPAAGVFEELDLRLEP